MPLSDSEIERVQFERMLVDPYDPALVQPASLDVRLGGEFRTMRAPGLLPGDSRSIVYPSRGVYPSWDTCHLESRGPDGRPHVFVIEPGDFVLAHTLETVRLPADVAAKLEGKSTLGRCGLVVHATAGFIDPGFHGQITLELSVVGPCRIALEPGMPIGQLVFDVLDRPAEYPYGAAELGSHYQGQRGATVPGGRTADVR